MCGLFSSAWYALMNIVVPFAFPGYDVNSQMVSELSAIGAPSRSLWVSMGIGYSILLAAFGAGVVWSAGCCWKLRLFGWSVIAQAAIGPFWPPMHLREVIARGGGDISDRLHIAFTFAWGLLAMAGMVLLALQLRSRFALYTWISMGVMVVTGFLTGSAAKNIEAGLPTPWMGLVERVNIGAYMLWVIVLTLILLRDPAAKRNCPACDQT